MHHSNLIATFVVAIAIVLCQPPAVASDELSAAWIAEHYDGLKLITPLPVDVDRTVTAACTTPAAAGSPNGPHARSKISIYANEAAEAALTRAGPFDPGSMVLKLKHRSGPNDRNKEAIGGMIKRTSGYNPAGGDWEYFYKEDGKLEAGLLPTCVECHASAATHDHIFGSWIDETTLRRSKR